MELREQTSAEGMKARICELELQGKQAESNQAVEVHGAGMHCHWGSERRAAGKRKPGADVGSVHRTIVKQILALVST